MTTTGQCPVCGGIQSLSLLCHSCTGAVERDLRSVPSLMVELDVTLSRQAKIGIPGKGGSPREKNPIHWAASTVSTDLTNTLTTWARDIAETDVRRGGALTAAQILLDHIDLIRRHQAVGELIDEIGDAVGQARRVIDRPAERTYVGPCQGVMRDEFAVEGACAADLYAKPDATSVECPRCELVTDVVQRKAWLLDEGRSMIVTAKEASVWIGEIGGRAVSETNIRNWVGRGKIPLRPTFSVQRQFELGALLDFIKKRNPETETLADMPIAV